MTTQNKFTPGPWGVSSSTMIVATTDKRDMPIIGNLFDLMGVSSIGLDETRANARLIAAAPELLEALHLLASFDDLQGMSDHIRERSGNNEDAQTPEETIYLNGISAARAAIAKATQTT